MTKKLHFRRHRRCDDDDDDGWMPEGGNDGWGNFW